MRTEINWFALLFWFCIFSWNLGGSCRFDCQMFLHCNVPGSDWNCKPKLNHIIAVITSNMLGLPFITCLIFCALCSSISGSSILLFLQWIPLWFYACLSIYICSHGLFILWWVMSHDYMHSKVVCFALWLFPLSCACDLGCKLWSSFRPKTKDFLTLENGEWKLSLGYLFGI